MSGTTPPFLQELFQRHCFRFRYDRVGNERPWHGVLAAAANAATAAPRRFVVVFVVMVVVVPMLLLPSVLLLAMIVAVGIGRTVITTFLDVAMGLILGIFV